MIKQKQGYILRNVMEEYMLFPVGEEMQEFKGTILLNELAAFIWEKLENPVDMDNLIKIILEEYSVEKEEVRNDLHEILNIFNEYGIIEYV